MSFCKKSFLLVAIFAYCTSGNSFNEANYPHVELPGIVAPFGDIEYDETPRDPAPCCFPSQWQGDVSSDVGFVKQRGRGKFQESTTTVYVDSTKYRVAGRTGAGNKSYSFILLFNSTANSSTVYAFNNATQQCVKKQYRNTEWHQQCLPPNSTFVRTMTLGPASGGLSVNVFRFFGAVKQGKLRALVAAKFLVSSASASTCLPVLLEEHGVVRLANEVNDAENSESFESSEESEFEKGRPRKRGGISFVSSVYFTGLQSQISDPSVFNVPSYCNKSIFNYLVFQPRDFELPEILDRFVQFN